MASQRELLNISGKIKAMPTFQKLAMASELVHRGKCDIAAVIVRCALEELDALAMFDREKKG